MSLSSISALHNMTRRAFHLAHLAGQRRTRRVATSPRRRTGRPGNGSAAAHEGDENRDGGRGKLKDIIVSNTMVALALLLLPIAAALAPPLSSLSALPIALSNCRAIRSTAERPADWKVKSCGSHTVVHVDGNKQACAAPAGSGRPHDALLIHIEGAAAQSWRLDVRFAAGEQLYDVRVPASGKLLVPPLGAIAKVHVFCMGQAPEQCAAAKWTLTVASASAAGGAAAAPCVVAAARTLEVWRRAPHLRTPTTRPMLFRASHALARGSAVAVATQLSVERLPKLVQMAQLCRWPISAAVHITHSERDLRLLTDGLLARARGAAVVGGHPRRVWRRHDGNADAERARGRAAARAPVQRAAQRGGAARAQRLGALPGGRHAAAGRARAAAQAPAALRRGVWRRRDNAGVDPAAVQRASGGQAARAAGRQGRPAGRRLQELGLRLARFHGLRGVAEAARRRR